MFSQDGRLGYPAWIMHKAGCKSDESINLQTHEWLSYRAMAFIILFSGLHHASFPELSGLYPVNILTSYFSQWIWRFFLCFGHVSDARRPCGGLRQFTRCDIAVLGTDMFMLWSEAPQCFFLREMVFIILNSIIFSIHKWIASYLFTYEPWRIM